MRNRGVLLSRYGLTWESFHALLIAQGGACAICGTTIRDEVGVARKEQACVDHCHSTGTVRGLLCAKCNLALGYLRDSPQIARNAATYLENANGSRCVFNDGATGASSPS